MKKTLLLLSTIALANSVFADSKYSWSIGGSVPTSHYLLNLDSTITMPHSKQPQSFNVKDYAVNSLEAKGFALNAAFNYKVTDNINIGIEGLYYLQQPFGANLSKAIQDDNENDFGVSKVFVSPIALSGPVILANASWDIVKFNEMTSLYLTGGIGMSYMTVEVDEIQTKQSGRDESTTVDMFPKYKSSFQLAWKLGFGTVLKLSESHSIDIGYSFVSLAKLGADQLDFPDNMPDDRKAMFSKITDEVFNRLATHNINVSFRFDL